MNHAMEPERKVRFSVMYTAQTRRKKKIWHDGEAIYLESKKKLILKDDNHTTLAGHWVYREPRQGEEIAFDGYLVQIDSKQEEMQGSQEPIMLRVAPVEPSVQQDTPELQQLLNKWKTGQLFPGTEKNRSAATLMAKTCTKLTAQTTNEPAQSAPVEESSFDAIGDLISWNGPRELPHNKGDSIYDLSVEPQNQVISLLSKPQEDELIVQSQKADGYGSDKEELFGEQDEGADGVQPSLLDAANTTEFRGAANSSDAPGLPSDFADPRPHQLGSQLVSSPSQIESSIVGSPVNHQGELAQLLHDSHNSTAPVQDASQNGSPTSQPSSQNGCQDGQNEFPSGSTATQDDPGSPAATQDDPPISRQTGPSLESLLAPTNRLQQGLHGLQRESLHRDTFSLQDSFKTAGQIEADKKPKKDEWIKRIPQQTPETGRWTWEAYWLVDYQVP